MSKIVKSAPPSRIASIDALRGFIMLVMIFVNDLSLIQGRIIPDWMVHFSDRAKGSGMTFVDLVLPAFIFIVGMSIPFSINSSKRQGKTSIQIAQHVLIRTLSLLFLGVIMVNGWPNSAKMGWSAPMWQMLMGVCAMLAFCQIAPTSHQKWAMMTTLCRSIGFIGLIMLAVQYVGKQGYHILTLSPFHIYPAWWGILGIIGWAYLIASLCYLIFQNHRTALLGCLTLLLCLFPAAHSALFRDLWLANYINIGATLGTQPAIAVAGMLLSTILITADTQTRYQRFLFILEFIIAMTLGGFLLEGLYGISKNQATPSWALWSCAVTASLWLCFYIIDDIPLLRPISKVFSIAGNNVLLAYLLSAIYLSVMINIGLGDWYKEIGQTDLAHAILKAFSISVLLLSSTALLNRLGFRLKL